MRTVAIHGARSARGTPAGRRHRVRPETHLAAWLGAVPFFAYSILFLFLPSAVGLLGAFKGEHGDWTTKNAPTALHQPQQSTRSKTSSRSACAHRSARWCRGLILAYAAIKRGTPKFVRSGLTTFSGVAANFGGIPLAFAFIATLGPLGIVTVFLRNHGYDPTAHGFNLFSKTGVELAYLYFQLPLMILVISPAIDGLRKEWREAASNLGANQWQFWRYVGLPVLMPSILGSDDPALRQRFRSVRDRLQPHLRFGEHRPDPDRQLLHR